MAKLRTGQKAERVTRFLLGLRDRRVAAAVVKHGFSQEDLDEGWTLLRACVGEKLDAAPQEGADADTLARLDAWENRWFPIARATLARRFPAVAQALFLNLSQTAREQVVVSVATLVDRIDALETGTPEEQAAHALLARRGLDGSRLAEARGLLDELGTVQTPLAEDVEAAQEAMRRAEDALWAWYLEWSAIARVAISRASLLRLLGFRGGRRAEPPGIGDGGDDIDDDDADDDDGDGDDLDLGTAPGDGDGDGAASNPASVGATPAL